MNNYQNFVGPRFQPMMQPYNFQQPMMAQMQNVPQVVEPSINYDFYGVQVKSFEEAQKYPYCCEKPLFLLDAQNEKVYIKKLENGIPSVVSYEMKEIKENTSSTVQKEEKIEKVEKPQVPQIDFSAELQKMKNELKAEMQNQIESLKTARENENKGNKKW